MNLKQSSPSVWTDLIIRGLRIGSSTVAIVELLRNNWIAAGLSSLAWLMFVQVERRRTALRPPSWVLNRCSLDVVGCKRWTPWLRGVLRKHRWHRSRIPAFPRWRPYAGLCRPTLIFRCCSWIISSTASTWHHTGWDCHNHLFMFAFQRFVKLYELSAGKKYF